MLSPSWIEQRFENVADMVMDILDHLVDDGLLSEGRFPLDVPLDAQTLKRMSDDQIKELLDRAGSIEEQGAILDKLEGIHIGAMPRA